MDRRGFLTATLLSLALLAAASSAAGAAPTIAPRDVIAPASPTEDVWWRRWGWHRRWRRWGWRRWRWRRRWWW